MANKAVQGVLGAQKQKTYFWFGLGHTVQAATKSEARARLRKVRGGRPLPPGTALRVIERGVV